MYPYWILVGPYPHPLLPESHTPEQFRYNYDTVGEMERVDQVETVLFYKENPLPVREPQRKGIAKSLAWEGKKKCADGMLAAMNGSCE